MSEAAPAVPYAVVVPFRDRLAQVARCIERILADASPDGLVLLVDDGSAPAAEDDDTIAALAQDPRVRIIRHDVNRGVAAARNAGLDWCRRARVALVLMIDSDCEPPPGWIAAHRALHAEHPDVAGIGAAIEGVGRGFWARLDRVMTWVHCMPYGGVREVRHPYHLTTTNFSVKLDRLPAREAVFDERLVTGEDALLCRELRARGERLLFFPAPRIHHFDRQTALAVLRHHYEYGHHQYFVQLGGDFAPRTLNAWYRAAFVLAFAPVLPLYALACCLLNLAPWLPHRPAYVAWLPLAYLLWLAKGVAILESAVRPRHVTRRAGPPTWRQVSPPLDVPAGAQRGGAA